MRDRCHGKWRTRLLVCSWQCCYWWASQIVVFTWPLIVFDTCIFLSSFRVIHSPSWGHPGSATETRRAFNSQVSQQKPSGHHRHQTFLQPHHQTQHGACALRGHRSGLSLVIREELLMSFWFCTWCQWTSLKPFCPPSLLPDNKSFFVLSMSDNVAQIYELMAPTVSDQKTWDQIHFDSFTLFSARAVIVTKNILFSNAQGGSV